MLQKRLIVFVAFIAFAAPAFASALTITELQVQLQVLLQKMELFKAQATSTPVAPTTCPNLMRNLTRGARGPDVIALQQFFVSQKYLAEDSATGFYGALTEEAVRKFQCAKKLVCSGTSASTGYGAVGARTRATILATCQAAIVTLGTTESPPPNMPTVAPPLLTPESVAPVDFSKLPTPPAVDQGGIHTYDECVTAGGKIYEDPPRRCQMPNDKYYLAGMPPLP